VIQTQLHKDRGQKGSHPSATRIFQNAALLVRTLCLPPEASINYSLAPPKPSWGVDGMGLGLGPFLAHLFVHSTGTFWPLLCSWLQLMCPAAHSLASLPSSHLPPAAQDCPWFWGRL
jgi:hypothetical protein